MACGLVGGPQGQGSCDTFRAQGFLLSFRVSPCEVVGRLGGECFGGAS